MTDSETPSSRVDLRKQMHEIVRLRQEMSAKSPEQRRTTTRAVARILDDVHLEGRMGKFVVESDEPGVAWFDAVGIRRLHGGHLEGVLSAARRTLPAGARLGAAPCRTKTAAA